MSLFFTPTRSRAYAPNRDNSPTSIAEDLHCEVSESRNSPPVSPKKLLFPKKASIGSLWSIEIQILRQSASSFEAATCIRRLSQVLTTIDQKDRLRFCYRDFENAVQAIRKNPAVWSATLDFEVTSIRNTFFNVSDFRKVPDEVVFEILKFLQIRDFSSVTSVCREWNVVGRSDILWSEFYMNRFSEPIPQLSTLSTRPTPPALQPSTTSLSSTTPTAIIQYRDRLMDPAIGDRVEVSWNGKFRLAESLDVYHGLAWWAAEIVDKNLAEGKYKVHYPGWDQRWDEWIPRHRLRWVVETDPSEVILVNDTVELWCVGANVPGAWLETNVKRIKNGKYCLGRVLSSGNLWVDRERIRIVRRQTSLTVMDPSQTDNPMPQTDRLNSTNNRCAIM